MDEVSVFVEAEVNLTESEDKVKRAIENIFGSLQMHAKALHNKSLLTAEAEGLETLTKLYNLLRRERIRDAARAALFEGLNGKAMSFYLNKQAAYAGHVSFSNATAESPLGPISVRIRCDNPRAVIDWLTSKNP